MPKRSLCIAALLINILICQAEAEWLDTISLNNNRPHQVEMLGGYECLIEIAFPGYDPSEDGELLPKIQQLMETNGGITASGFINMPPYSTIDVQVVDCQYRTYSTDIASLKSLNSLDLGNNAVEFPSGTITLSSPGIMRDLRITPIAIRPFCIDSETNTIHLTTNLTLHITFPQGNGSNPKLTARPPSRAFTGLYEKLVWNYVRNETDDFTPSNYVIICPDEMVDGILPLYQWKNRKGLRTTIVTFSEINANSQDEAIVKNFLEYAYYYWEYPPDYVLLVGDESQFPIHLVYTADPQTPFSYYSCPGYYINENYFACLEGDDYFPDIHLGRFVTPNWTGALLLSNKTVMYEKNTFTAGVDWYDKGLMCADQTEASQRITKLYVREVMLNDGGFAQVDTLFENGQSALFMNWVNNGRSFINYRGSGWSNGWAGVGVYVGTLNSLYNYFKLPVVTAIGCGVSKFDTYSTCFGEAWMNAGTLTSHLGAVSFIGPTWNTHTNYNNYLDRGIYDALFTDSLRNVSPALVAGKMLVQSQYAPYIAVYSTVEEIVRVLFGQYIIMSDPELTTRAAAPLPILVNHPDSVLLGEGTLEITAADTSGAPLPGLQVCAYIEGETFAVDLTEPDGAVTLEINPQTRPNYLYITVSGLDIETYCDSVSVEADAQYVGNFRYDIIEDPPGDGLIAPGETILLSELAKNYGVETAYGVWGILSTSAQGVELEIDSSFFGDIPPEGEAWGGVDYRFTLPEEYPGVNLPITITFHDQENYAWDSHLNLTVHHPLVIFQEFSVDPGPDNILERGGEADVAVTVQNIGNLPALYMTAELNSLDPEVIIISGASPLGSIGVGEVVSTTASPFVIQVSDFCPNNFLAHFQLVLSGDQGAFFYEVEFEFEFVVGEPSAVDPTTDEQNLYYAYEARDSAYIQAPEYYWTEISPAEGGAGTPIEFDEQSQTAIIEIPFDWVYYGETFSRLTVCADGYIVPDSAGYSLPPGWSVIVYDAAPGAVAPLWYDMLCPVYEPGDVSYLYNPLDGSFRIEYHNWSHANTNLSLETFQLAIYDPEVRVTQTGDSEIEFIYNDITPLALANSNCGIENPIQSDGVEMWHNNNYPNTVWQPIPYTAILFTTNEPEFVGIGDYPQTESAPPHTVFLRQNYPNPFNPVTNINFGIPNKCRVTLEVYNILGCRVAALVDDTMEPGLYDIRWNANANSSGIYFIRLRTPADSRTVKCLLMK